MIPHLISSELEAQVDLSTYLQSQQEELLEKSNQHGALLFRGFNVKNVDNFSEVCSHISNHLLDYIGGGSPRTHLKNKIYSSTEYPPALHIPLHMEASYMKTMPKWVFFYSEIVATEGGRTPIGDMREVYLEIDPDIIENFRTKDLCYIQNLHSGAGFGKSWQQTFESDDLDLVLERLKNLDLEYEWKKDILHVRYLAPAITKHSISHQEIWSNQVVNWHHSSFPEKTQSALKHMFKSEMDYPKTVCFSDGNSIDPSDVKTIKDLLLKKEQKFDWQAGDVLWVDNHRISHGREPFKGDRKVYVAMA